MVYIIYYRDDKHKQHITFVKSFKNIRVLKERFGEITIKSYKN